MISWLQQYQGYIVYPSLILGMIWGWVTMPKRKIIRLPHSLSGSVETMQGLKTKFKGEMTK